MICNANHGFFYSQYKLKGFLDQSHSFTKAGQQKRQNHPKIFAYPNKEYKLNNYGYNKNDPIFTYRLSSVHLQRFLGKYKGLKELK